MILLCTGHLALVLGADTGAFALLPLDAALILQKPFKP